MFIRPMRCSDCGDRSHWLPAGLFARVTGGAARTALAGRVSWRAAKSLVSGKNGGRGRKVGAGQELSFSQSAIKFSADF